LEVHKTIFYLLKAVGDILLHNYLQYTQPDLLLLNLQHVLKRRFNWPCLSFFYIWLCLAGRNKTKERVLVFHNEIHYLPNDIEVYPKPLNFWRSTWKYHFQNDQRVRKVWYLRL